MNKSTADQRRWNKKKKEKKPQNTFLFFLSRLVYKYEPWITMCSVCVSASGWERSNKIWVIHVSCKPCSDSPEQQIATAAVCLPSLLGENGTMHMDEDMATMAIMLAQASPAGAHKLNSNNSSNIGYGQWNWYVFVIPVRSRRANRSCGRKLNCYFGGQNGLGETSICAIVTTAL